ncbi:MAG: hypothetical protein Q8L81_15100 [Bacteroidota bacterium]|nr:hypothetical protein [Bacteroidota bacterium]
MVIAEFQQIEKEEIENLKFPSTEVLHDLEKRKERLAELDKALTLGNREHSKIRIYFEDDASCKVVETTVWGITDKRVILKQGVVIPIHRVHSVKL